VSTTAEADSCSDIDISHEHTQAVQTRQQSIALSACQQPAHAATELLLCP